MFHVTIPHPYRPESFILESKGSSEPAKQKHRSEYFKSRSILVCMRIVQFGSPVLGMFLYMASFASDHWITTGNGTYHWGLLIECQAEANSSDATVSCSFITAGESSAYFEAARVFSCVAVVLYIVLLFHFILVEVRVCGHQLASIVAVLLTCHIAVVLLLVGTNYSADVRWKNKEPSLGWSFWVAMSAVVCSLLAAITLTFRGHEVYTTSDLPKKLRLAKVHPEMRPRQKDKGNSELVSKCCKDRIVITQSTEGQEEGRRQHGNYSEDSSESPGRQWKRRLSPIQERCDNCN